MLCYYKEYKATGFMLHHMKCTSNMAVAIPKYNKETSLCSFTLYILTSAKLLSYKKDPNKQTEEAAGNSNSLQHLSRREIAANYAVRQGWGNLFSAKGHLVIYNVIPGPYKMINLKMILLYLVSQSGAQSPPCDGRF